MEDNKLITKKICIDGETKDIIFKVGNVPITKGNNSRIINTLRIAKNEINPREWITQGCKENKFNLSTVEGKDNATKNFVEDDLSRKLFKSSSDERILASFQQDLTPQSLFQIKDDERNPDNTVVTFKPMIEIGNNEDKKQLISLYMKVLLSPDQNPRLLSAHFDDETHEVKYGITKAIEIQKVERRADEKGIEKDKKDAKLVPILEDIKYVKPAENSQQNFLKVKEAREKKERHSNKYELWKYIKKVITATDYWVQDECYISVRNISIVKSDEPGSSVKIIDDARTYKDKPCFYGRKEIPLELNDFEKSYGVKFTQRDIEDFKQGKEFTFQIPFTYVKSRYGTYIGLQPKDCNGFIKTFTIGEKKEEPIGIKMNTRNMTEWFKEYFVSNFKERMIRRINEKDRR